MTHSSHAINFCPYCGTPVDRRSLFGKQRAVCPACDWIHFEDPKVAVTAVVIQENQILLVRRANQPHVGEWSLPGGFMDAGEQPEQAVQRECLEETGLNVQVTNLVTLISGREHSRGADILLAYQAKVTGGQMQAGDDASEASFFSFGSLPPVAFESTRKIITLVASQ